MRRHGMLVLQPPGGAAAQLERKAPRQRRRAAQADADLWCTQQRKCI